MEPQTGFEPAFAIQLPYSPFVAEGVTAALNLVRVEGLEPPRYEPLGPKPSASTNSAILAYSGGG